MNEHDGLGNDRGNRLRRATREECNEEPKGVTATSTRAADVKLSKQATSGLRGERPRRRVARTE